MVLLFGAGAAALFARKKFGKKTRDDQEKQAA